MFNIIGKRYWFFLLSAIVILPGVVSLVSFGLKPGPDFAGGTELEVRIPQGGQTVQLNNLYTSATKTPPLPPGKVLSESPGGSQITVRVANANASATLTAAAEKAIGHPPAGVQIIGSGTCTTCRYQIVSSSPLTAKARAKLAAALVKDFPKSSTVAAGSIVSVEPGTVFRVRIPEKDSEVQLQSLIQSSLATVSQTFETHSASCPTDCLYRIQTTALSKASTTSFKTDFVAAYPKSPAQPGIQPEFVQPVQDAQCPTGCYIIRSKLLSTGQVASVGSALKKQYPSSETSILTYSSVGPTVAASTKQNAILAVAVAAIFILAYITFAFRKMSHPARYGTAAIIAMLHDVLVVVGIFSILGKVLNVEVDATFVTALLTIIGFSVHDTIVIFDRIRENVTRRTGESFEAIVNHSVLQSFVRSINTSFTVVLTLGAIFLFTGESIRYFVLAMLIGIISGTYSSIFNASPILVVWETGELRRIFRRGAGTSPLTPDDRTSRNLRQYTA